MKRITDPSFKYTRAVETDIRKTFRKARAEIAARQKEREDKVAGEIKPRKVAA